MNIPGYAAAAVKFFRRHNALPTAPAGDRERGIASIERALRARGRRRRLTWTASGIAVAAALTLTWQLARHWSPAALRSAANTVSINASPAGDGAAIRIGGNEQALAEPAELEANQLVETPLGGGATLRVSTGTLMQLAGGTIFRVDTHGLTQRFELRQGTLNAKVAKLTGSQRFIVATPDAEVEVRGTRFVLRVLERGEACGGGSRTRLQVTEGVVEVRAEGNVARISADQHWPNDCETTDSVGTKRPQLALAPGAASSDTEKLVRPEAETSKVAALPRGPNEPPSALAQQNDLFAKAVALRRQGNVGAALRAYDDLIKRFPASPLAENALAERMRMLATKTAGAAEARRYLARYPRGFAREEAQTLAEMP
jgi:hypothetical protein